MSNQKRILENLWFVFGNYGPKYTHGNHRFIQMLLEDRGDLRNLYKPTQECIEAVDKILKEHIQ